MDGLECFLPKWITHFYLALPLSSPNIVSNRLRWLILFFCCLMSNIWKIRALIFSILSLGKAKWFIGVYLLVPHFEMIDAAGQERNAFQCHSLSKCVLKPLFSISNISLQQCYEANWISQVFFFTQSELNDSFRRKRRVSYLSITIDEHWCK